MQKQKKQFIILIVLLIICVGAWLGIRAYNDKAEEKEKKEAEAKKITVAEISADDITAFSYDSDGTELSFSKTDGTWIYDGDPSVPLDQDAMTSLLSNVEKVTAEDEVKDYDDISDYGFDEPTQTIHVTTADQEYVFTFGMNNSLLNQDYMMSEGDDTVYLVSTTMKNAFTKTVSDLTKEEDTETEAVPEEGTENENVTEEVTEAAESTEE